MIPAMIAAHLCKATCTHAEEEMTNLYTGTKLDEASAKKSKVNTSLQE
jgi:hypothetical protein